MSCYMRHLEDFFTKLDIEYSTKNKKDMHVLMQEFSHEKNCPKVWEFIKPIINGEEPDKELIEFVERHWGGESKLDLTEQKTSDIPRGPRAQ